MRKVFLTLLLLFFVFAASALDFMPPLKSYIISSPLGFRKAPMGGLEDGLHRGIDMVPTEILENKKAIVAVRAAESGTVVTLYPPPNGYFKGHPLFGGLIIIYHGDGTFTLYGHLRETWVREGQRVKRGQGIGIVGSTGISTGPHLHFEIVYDPVLILQECADARNEKLYRKWFFIEERIAEFDKH